MDDLLQDTANDNGGGEGGDDGDGGEPVRDPEITDLFESITNRLDHDDVLFGSPSWLENFREMKQAAIDLLYKDYPKQWTALRFTLQMLMLKARHGRSDTSFNDLLHILGDTYSEGNKVPANTYRAKKLTRSMAMKLKKFHACPNHCILYWGKCENLQSCPHYGVGQYKGNAGCRMDADDERRPKKKKKTTKKSTAKKQIPSPEGEEEEGYTQKKSLALSMWYLPVIDRLCAIFGNPEDAKLKS
jgi:hypothetical protein